MGDSTSTSLGLWAMAQVLLSLQCSLEFDIRNQGRLLLQVVHLTFCSNPFGCADDLREAQGGKGALLLFIGQDQHCHCCVGRKR